MIYHQLITKTGLLETAKRTARLYYRRAIALGLASNPILPTIASSRIQETELINKIIGVVPRASSRPTAKQLENWKHLSRMFRERKPTKRERESAWKKGIVI